MVCSLVFFCLGLCGVVVGIFRLFLLINMTFLKNILFLTGKLRFFNCKMIPEAQSSWNNLVFVEFIDRSLKLTAKFTALQLSYFSVMYFL